MRTEEMHDPREVHFPQMPELTDSGYKFCRGIAARASPVAATV